MPRAGILSDMSEQPATVSVDDLRPPSPRVAAWQDAVQRAERGETVAVIAHGEHVADVVPSGELDRLRETIDILSDQDLVRALADREPVVRGIDAIKDLIAQRTDHEQM
jgi:antitoxin (DNA-binding transcriptional repressor) of toxin-antitoxin stability system